MTQFVRTTIATADFKAEEKWRGRIIVRIKEQEQDGQTVCAEATVSEGYDKDALQKDYTAWKAAEDAQALATAIRAKQEAINAYDTSAAVNSFTLASGGQTVEYWLPRATRNSLAKSAAVWEAAGHEAYTLDLREYATSISVPCQTLLKMLDELEQYAISCYNTTSAHLAAVSKLTSVSDVEAYDITQGYPAKLSFSF